MLAEWIKSLDKLASERTDEDLEIIYKKLKAFKLFRRVHPSVIQQLCFVAIIEHIEKGVVLYKQGEEALNWYALIYGSLDVQISHTGKRKDVVNVCTLCSGTAFGECVLTDGYHSVSVISNESCTLLRVPKPAFQDIWQRSSHYMDEIISSPFSVANVAAFDSTATQIQVNNKPLELEGAGVVANSSAKAAAAAVSSGAPSGSLPPNQQQQQPSSSDPSSTVIQVAGEERQLAELQLPDNIMKLMHIGWIIRLTIDQTAPHLIRDRKHPSAAATTFDRCFIGSELTDWLMNTTMSSSHVKVRSRKQAESVYQVLYENKVIYAVFPSQSSASTSQEEDCFQDRYAFYRFCFDDAEDVQAQTLMAYFRQTLPPDEGSLIDALFENLSYLLQMAPEATLRQILRKKPENRTEDDIDLVYEDIMNIKAFSHLSNTVKKELSAVIAFEAHKEKSTTLFKQGDRGTSGWFIILKGSVSVVIASKGIVCTLHEGDDFGKLALVNEAPRAATIITNEPDCQFLRVDKVHFDRILKDNEANTVRLKEHGKEVLILQKMSLKQLKDENSSLYFKYKVMAGTAEKVLEHLLETRMNSHNYEEQFNKESLFEDFLLTFPIFISWKQMTYLLVRHYKIDELNFRQMESYIIGNKKRVVRFVILWYKISGDAFLNNKLVWTFVDELMEMLEKDNAKYGNSFEGELSSLRNIKEAKATFDRNLEMRGIFVWKADNSNSVRRMSNINENLLASMEANQEKSAKMTAIKDFDEIICRVYCADHTYTTLKMTMNTKVDSIKDQAVEKLNLDNTNDYMLVELKSDNERIVFNEMEMNIPTTLSLNGRIFISHVDHLDALTILPEQEGPSVGSINNLESFNSQEIAFYLSTYSWKLFFNIHPYEFIYHVFGRHNFNDITSNLDLFRRHYNELQYWVITEVLLEKSLSRRVSILKKFIKIAGYCKEYKNLNAFFAIIIGLSNVAVSRLTQTWERLHSKLKRIFTQYESLIDSSRNYRRYRVVLSKFTPPLIPFVPLLIKDATMVHEGNKTFVDQGLVNFEKMHLLGQTLRMIQECKSGSFQLESPVNLSVKKLSSPISLQDYFESYIRVIDNQKRLMQLSYSLEHRKL